MTTFIFLFFGFILLLSCLREIKYFDFIWNRFPLLMQFIPTWSFFAPVPNMFDYHLLYREVSLEGDVKDWNVIYSLDDHRHFYSFLWNPKRRFTKAILDMSMELVRFSNKINDKQQICLSLPYLQILNCVDAHCQRQVQRHTKVQFIILTNSRVHDYEVAFLSEVHPLTRTK